MRPKVEAFPRVVSELAAARCSKVTVSRAEGFCHCTPKVVFGSSSSARIRICGPVGCCKDMMVWLRQCPRSSLHGKWVPGCECSQAGDCVASEESQRELDVLGACGAPVAFDCSAQGGFPVGPNHTGVAALIIPHIPRSPHNLPANCPYCSRSVRACFRGGYFCKRKGDCFPGVQPAQLFDHADKRGKTCPSRNHPSGNQILPLSPFLAGSCPIVILQILAAPGLPLARFRAFKAVQAASAIWLTASLVSGK